MGIKFEEDINKDNIELLCHWSNKPGSEFQEQWHIHIWISELS